MITELTREQSNRLIEFRDKWLNIGLCTEPANRKEAEKGIELAYNIAGLKKPKIIWCLSPLSAGLTNYFIRKNVEDLVRVSVWASVRASVWD